jgi:hypothetical protein
MHVAEKPLVSFFFRITDPVIEVVHLSSRPDPQPQDLIGNDAAENRIRTAPVGALSYF